MKLVYICSPLRGDINNNIKKAINYCEYASNLDVIPLAPHTIFTQYLDDLKEKDRKKGLKMGLSLLRKCDELWVFGNLISNGMKTEIELAQELGMTIKHFTEIEGGYCVA